MCIIFFLPEYMIYIGTILVIPAFIVCIYGMLSLRSSISKERREFNFSSDDELVRMYEIHHKLDESYKELAKSCRKNVRKLTSIYALGIVALFVILFVVNNIMLLASALAFLQIYAYFQLPKKHAEAWEKSPMHISNGKYYFLCCLSLFAYICIFINSCRSLKLPVVIISLIAIVVCMAYGWFRSVSPDVKMETSVWED